MSRNARVIAIASGKGGVGKTSLGVNLSIALARQGSRAMLVDGDVGLANANILLGMNATSTIADVIAQGACVADVVLRGPGGMILVPGHSGGGIGLSLTDSDRDRLGRAFRPYAGQIDHVLVDTASGISAEALEFVAASDLILIVLSAEPTAFMDAYQLVKVLAVGHDRTEIAIVTNMVDDEPAGRQLFAHFQEVVRRFLKTRLSHLGSIPRDEHVREAVLRKRPCMDAFPDSRASAAFARLARTLSERDVPTTRGGDRFFAMEEALCGAD